MPKRSAQSRIARYENKIRKIEEQEKRRRYRIPLDSSSEDEGNEDLGQAVDANHEVVWEPTTSVAPELSQDPAPALPPQPTDQDKDPAPECPNQPADTEDELDPDLLSALGESTSDAPEYGANINDNLTKLWLPLLKKGMPKDGKDKICSDYLVPDNCRLLQAPKLNAEISAAVPDMVRNRDKILVANQQQLGLGITAVNRGIDILLRTDDKAQALKHISNGCRLLCDLHHLKSKNRIKLITPSLDKSFLHTISESERDETLFGSSLAEKIKAAKAIEKQGLQIKKPAPKPQKSMAPQAARPTSYQGNWSAPPRYQSANRGGRTGYRRPQATAPATRRSYSTTSHPPRAAAQDKPRAPAQGQ